MHNTVVQSVHTVMFFIKGFTYMCTVMKFLRGDWHGSKTIFTVCLQIRCNHLLHSWFARRALQSSTQQRSENIFKSVSTRCKKNDWVLNKRIIGGLDWCGHRGRQSAKLFFQSSELGLFGSGGGGGHNL
jgi:hypothetical protein